MTSCDNHGCNKKENLKKCKYCGKNFCPEHLRAVKPGMPHFKSSNPEDLEFLEKDYSIEEGHPCPDYYDYLIKKRKKEEENYNYALNNLLKKPEEKIVSFRAPVQEKTNLQIGREPHYEKNKKIDYPQKKNKKRETKRKNNKLFLIVFAILGIVLFSYFQISAVNFKNKIESKNITVKLFEEINNFRTQNGLERLNYNSESYKIAINLSKNFYESNNYYISQTNLESLSAKYSIYDCEYITTKLENLNEAEFNLMVSQWITQNITSKKILNKNITDGALGCYKEACVLILSINFQEENSVKENISSTALTIKKIIEPDYSEYATEPKTVHLSNIDFTVYRGLNDYLAGLDRSISYYYTPPTTKDFILKDLDNKIQKEFLMELVEKIKNETDNKKTQADIAIRIVQGIPYDWDAYNSNNIEGRLPYEVLYDMKGVCMEKADLLAFLLRELGFGVAIFEFNLESHRAVGIKCENGNYDSEYCFIESTDYYPLGQIPYEYVGGVDIRNANPEIVIISEGLSYS